MEESITQPVSVPFVEALTREELDFLQANLDRLSRADQEELLEALGELERRRYRAQAHASLLAFACALDPNYRVGAHHKRLAGLLESVDAGERDRLAVSVAPRMGKSRLVSILFCAWYLGKHPDQSIILASHTGDLAVEFGRTIRNIIASNTYRSIFPGVSLAVDSKSAGRWNTNHGGGFYATGVGSALAGRGANIIVIDDPLSEQSLLAGNTSDFAKVYDWFTMGARTRLTKDGKIVIVHTRWHPLDLIGRLISDMANNEDSDQYEIFEFPAILNENTDHEKALWPEFFPLEALHRTKASMPLFQWNAQYQQNPTTEQGAIVKRDSWMPWTLDEPPKCSFVILALDAAAETKTRNDFTAATVWGVFKHDVLTRGENHIILLNAVNVRVTFPQLKALALRLYKEWKPDSFIVEKKSNGTALYQELRRMGLAVTEYNPSRATGDKLARLNAISDIFVNKVVWYPQGRKWAEQVIEQVAGFPAVEHDDLVDCVSMSLSRFREGGFLQLSTDEKEVEAMPHDYSYY